MAGKKKQAHGGRPRKLSLPRVPLMPSELKHKPNLTVDEVVAFTSVPRSRLYRMTKEGNGPKWFFMGNRRMCRTGDVIAWIDKLSNDTPLHAN